MGNSTDNSTKIAVAQINARAKIEAAKIQAQNRKDIDEMIINQKSAQNHNNTFNANLRAKELNENRLEIERIKYQARIDAEKIRQNSRQNSRDNTASVLIGVLIVLSFMAYFALPSILR